MSTAELAVALPAVVLVLALCLTAMTLAVDQVRVEDAARAAARAASSGESAAAVGRIVEELTPEGSLLGVSSGGEEVVVTVEAPARASWLGLLPPARARAVARWEPGARP
ncbi:TadE family type IV pilus minor pilin [Ornithinimicrobium sp. W1679]|uniref:TadE family type IV pilus minor pilin n=1 Tax=unclassified Ornithinimicrobium TaxID=2615080 RepID=UPI003CF22D30